VNPALNKEHRSTFFVLLDEREREREGKGEMRISKFIIRYKVGTWKVFELIKIGILNS
jgi:hypothetical protein